MSSSPYVSVVVCTYNRVDLLPIVLDSLGRQTLDESLFEVIIVDNNSSDRTREVAEAYCLRHPNFRYVLEQKQGLSHARNRGWQEAGGTYVGYIDDDGKAPEQWLTVAKEIITEQAPGVMGGPYYAFYNSARPKWWKDEYRSAEHAESARPLSKGEFLSGGNLFFRRDLLVEMGGFDPQHGMVGEEVRMGEETRLILDIRDARPGELIYYDPRLHIYHLVPPDKMKLRWLMRLWFADGRSSHRVFARTSAEGGTSSRSRRHLAAKMLRTAADFVVDTVRSLVLRDREQYPYLQNYIFEVASKRVRAMGSIYARWSSLNKS